ncbi:energy-coupling factor ABC transporter ATP-binding protein [Acidimicrobiia bacterium]|nr:energy-coupling factor ABC transporter ATP-binding protein [Acidimicrobiia bacterium]
MSETNINCTKVAHTYPNGVQAIKDVDVTIEQGEIVSVVGQNGSGKTTLVKHFNGLLKPTDGDIMIGDLNTRENSVGKLARQVGYVFQNPNHQIFAASVHEELSFGLKNIGLNESEVETKVIEIAEEFLLTEYLELNPYRLGFSLRKTVAMASIIAMEPNVVVLDEPTTGQDYSGVKTIKDSMEKLKSQGKTVIVVSHDMPLVAEETDRVLVMCNTELIFDGPPTDLFINKPILEKTNLKPPQITAFAEAKNFGNNKKAILSVEDALKYT